MIALDLALHLVSVETCGPPNVGKRPLCASSYKPILGTSCEMEGFIAGFAYGTTSVVVGQPLDTIKTKMQMLSSPLAKGLMRRPSSLAVGHEIYIKEGIRGLYRGGTSLLLGGALIRSAQFGVNGLVLELLRTKFGGPTKAEDRIFKVIDPQVVVSGFCGGVARGIVEGPFEYVKVRRQVDMPWKMREMWNGAGATVLRNSFLFGSFVISLPTKSIFFIKSRQNGKTSLYTTFPQMQTF